MKFDGDSFHLFGGICLPCERTFCTVFCVVPRDLTAEIREVPLNSRPALPLAELRDREASRGRELRRAGATQSRPGRESGSDRYWVSDNPGRGFDRGAGVRGAGAERLPRALRIRPLSPPTAVQWRRRLSGGQNPSRERPQCRGLGNGVAARDRATAAGGQGSCVSGGRG
jgi:hypothetical protein